jgi:hypothetical protein
MFRRYILTRFDAADGRWRKIFDDVGVSCERNLPVPIADDLIARIRAAEVDGAIPGETRRPTCFASDSLLKSSRGRSRHSVEKSS